MQIHSNNYELNLIFVAIWVLKNARKYLSLKIRIISNQNNNNNVFKETKTTHLTLFFLKEVSHQALRLKYKAGNFVLKGLTQKHNIKVNSGDNG